MIEFETDHLELIFLPYFARKRKEAQHSMRRFAHYTSAEAARKMLDNEEVWLRKSSVMNDFSEIEFGFNCLNMAWNSQAGQKFKGLLNSMFDGSAARIENMFNQQLPQMRWDTYLACISEHDHGDEDRFGRLSMWRAYGNVAVVLNPTVFMRATVQKLQAYSNPVDYHTPESFQAEFEAMVDRVAHNFDYLKARGESHIWSWVLFMLRQFVLCTKHKGFSEEREWRIIYDPNDEPSPLIRKEVEVIRNVAQPVVKLRLMNLPEDEVVGLDLPSLIERIIIGPSQYPLVQQEAFATLLANKGVVNPYARIFVSDIPLRQ